MYFKFLFGLSGYYSMSRHQRWLSHSRLLLTLTPTSVDDPTVIIRDRTIPDPNVSTYVDSFVIRLPWKVETCKVIYIYLK